MLPKFASCFATPGSVIDVFAEFLSSPRRRFVVELQTKFYEYSTITEKAPTTLLRHYAKQKHALSHGKYT